MLKRATSNLRISSGLHIIPLNGELANCSLYVAPNYISGFSRTALEENIASGLRPMAEASKEDHAHKEDFWENDLRI